MTIYFDKKNKIAIESTSTKASDYLYKNKNMLGLEEVCSSYNEINSNFSCIGYRTLTATKYVKEFEINIK